MSLYDDLGVSPDADMDIDTAARCERATLHAFAMPHGAPDGSPGVHVTLRASGLVVTQRLKMAEAITAHARLGSAIDAFAVALTLSGNADSRWMGINLGMRDRERLYRAKLAVRLGLAEGDIRAVFDLSDHELAALRAEVAGA